MSSKFVKVACAVALSAPLLVVGQMPAQAKVGPSESDCDGHPTGAITKHPGPNYDCYGIDDAFQGNNHRNHNGNRPQTAQATATTTATPLLCPDNLALQFVSVDLGNNGTVDYIVPAGQLNNASAIPNGTNPVGVVVLAGQALGGGNTPPAAGDIVTITCA